MSEFLEVKTHALAANVPLDLMGTANFFQLFQAPSAVKIEFFKKQTRTGLAEDALEGFRRGPLGEGKEFDWVRVTSTVAQNVQICRASGEASLQRIVGNITASLSKSQALDSLPDVAVGAGATAVIAAADANQRELIVSNPATNASTFRVGDAGAGAANGTPLPPGATLVISTAAAVSAYNPGALAESLTVTRVKD